MAASPPASPSGLPQRPLSAAYRPDRSSSRLSLASRHGGGGSRASDDDGKTSVKVAVRIRPPLNASDPGFDLIPQRFQRPIAQVISPTSLAVESPQGRKIFVFDRVFGGEVSQEGVWEYLSESVTAFVQGYNVSLLAYGQSGSGKSHTMGTSGPLDQSDPTVMGVIPRAAAALFDQLGAGRLDARGGLSALRAPKRYSMASPAVVNQTKENGWAMKATYVEIYNEQLRDLLLPESVPPHERGGVIIREDAKGRILLTGLHQIPIHSIDDLLAALNFGSSIRQTDATAINAKSSRSHAVFSISLTQRKTQNTPVLDKRRSVPVDGMSGAESWVTVDSKLHFVDLAGSERLKNTGAQGERVKEGISINAGLASLGKVISQLSSRQPGSHVSYRDSKLTRLLQDSLGGNAITYMIACVTPAEFHLSETLNTVQYAQRARAIQSKPQIQQVMDDDDKQAIIDRLRAEIAFLRDQIRHAERAERKTNAPPERGERQNEREADLQNQLLDLQEGYSALSQRHARLVAEMAKAQDSDEVHTANGHQAAADGALERIKRSNSFAQAVEQVVLEYEKTIQSLEASLSNTRSTLAATESSLLEKESKCAYGETTNQQLQARLQKLMDRETSTEHYLVELEGKLDGHTSGQEKNAALVVELRKETARLRENEASCEDYISTLEERLAEADQDTELMQREIGRLENVVERQRSLGKLDHLLHELEHEPNHRTAADLHHLPRAPSSLLATRVPYKPMPSVDETPMKADGAEYFDAAESPVERVPATSTQPDGEARPSEPAAVVVVAAAAAEGPERAATDGPEKAPATPQDAQSEFVAEKLDTVTQELFDLRLEHETTVHDLDLLSAKYEEALRTLGQLQEVVDDARHPASREAFATPASTRPSSFLGDARVAELKESTHLSSSRSLSSELYSAGESPNTTEPSDVESTIKRGAVAAHGRRASTPTPEQLVAQELEQLKGLHAEKDGRLRELTEQHDQLQAQHQSILDEVEELKTAVSKARMSQGPIGGGASLIRRKSSQNVMMVDRAHRSFASLRNIATENFEHQPDLLQAFEVNLNAAMHELHARSERVQELEADIAGVKKEMELKMTIISGLTRERSSLKHSTPMEMTVVSTMRDQLLQSENTIRALHESQATREQTMVAEMEALQRALADRDRDRDRATGPSDRQPDATIRERDEVVSPAAPGSPPALDDLRATMGAEMDQERAAHRTLIDALQRTIDEHAHSLQAYRGRVAELEQVQSGARRALAESAQAREAQAHELDTHRGLVSTLEQQVVAHRSTIDAQEQGLKSLQERHGARIEELQRAAQADVQQRLAEQSGHEQEAIRVLQAELGAARDEMGRLLPQLAAVLQEETTVDTLHGQVQALVAHKQESDARCAALTAEHDRLRAERATLAATIAEMTQLHAESMKEIERLHEQCQKSSRIVEDLEEQLTANYDQHQAAHHRLSTLESEHHQQLDETLAAKNQAVAELAAVREELAKVEAKLYASPVHGGAGPGPTMDDGGGGGSRQRSSSIASNLRKSASVASLPSPPPAIPLPPLPTNAPGGGPASMANGIGIGIGIGASAGSRHAAAAAAAAGKDNSDEVESRLRTVEHSLAAEKRLNSALEEALEDIENQGKKAREDLELWKKKAWAYEDEIEALKTNQKTNRYSMQAVEEERMARKQAEAARAQLEERMNALNKKKKKGALNCF
ncbi:MAG: hypothetical protein M1826_005288 [Phylliscum demangeonii]|nr:MAG: hypothetical protein M1826_005288 [Phylliscum demangeonii]